MSSKAVLSRVKFYVDIKQAEKGTCIARTSVQLFLGWYCLCMSDGLMLRGSIATCQADQLQGYAEHASRSILRASSFLSLEFHKTCETTSCIAACAEDINKQLLHGPEFNCAKLGRGEPW